MFFFLFCFFFSDVFAATGGHYATGGVFLFVFSLARLKAKWLPSALRCSATQGSWSSTCAPLRLLRKNGFQRNNSGTSTGKTLFSYGFPAFVWIFTGKATIFMVFQRLFGFCSTTVEEDSPIRWIASWLRLTGAKQGKPFVIFRILHICSM